jgi:hypothetical protein
MPRFEAHYTECVVGEGLQLKQQLHDLDRVLDYLERMNLRQLTEVPASVNDLLIAAGVDNTRGERPMALIPRVLNRQQHLRRQLSSMHRTRTS